MPSRLAQPLQTLLRLLQLTANLLLSTARFGLRVPFARLQGKKMPWRASLGLSMAEFCVRSGATFIKVGQLLSTRQDLLPPEMLPPLLELQDRVAPFSFREVPKILRSQFGRSPRSIFAAFNSNVLASASIANVYKARLHDGRVVAVKIRRPGIARQVHDDLRIMEFVAGLMSRLPAFRLVPVVEVIGEFSQAIVQQLDFRREAANNKRFQESFAHNPGVRIPRLVEELCTDEVLTMEYVPNLGRLNLTGSSQGSYKEALITGLRALYQMIFVDGFIHCDLHTGNLYLRDDGTVVILDTGFVATLPSQDRHDFVDFFYAIAGNDGIGCARIMYETASYKSPRFDKAEFDKTVIALIEKTSGAKAGAFEVSAFVVQLFDMQRRFGLRGTSNFTMVILSLLVFEGLAKLVYPELDFQGEAIPFLTPILFQHKLTGSQSLQPNPLQR